jgi:hypothetical protein
MTADYEERIVSKRAQFRGGHGAVRRAHHLS